MEYLDYLKIIEKIGVEKDLSRLTEEEILFYDMVKAIKSKSADDERQIIQQVIKQFKQQQFILKTNENRINMKTTNKTWIGIAAGVAILVVAYFFLWNRSMSNEEILSQYYKPSTEFISIAKDKATQYGMASSATGGRDSLLQAMTMLEQFNYEDAVKILMPFVENYPTDNMARFHLADCQLNRGKYSPALTHFSKLNEIANDLDTAMVEKVKFNLALCFLQMTDGKRQAIVLLEQVISMEGMKSKAAKGLLDYLQK